MKTLSAFLLTHLDGELTTLAELIRITRTDGVIIGLTNHDRDLTVGDVTYQADASFTADMLDEATSLKASDVEVSGLLSSAAITDDALRAGLYDYARIDFERVNWREPSQGTIHLRRGWLGEVMLMDGTYKAALRSFQDLLSRKVGETYTPECRFDLGDSRCGVDLSATQVTGTVTALYEARSFQDYTRGEASGLYNDAKLTWLTGANAGHVSDVMKWDYDALTFTLWLAPPQAIAPGDTYKVCYGCDKRFATCRARFNNGANYGGFPYLPGLGKILQYPDNR